MTGLQLIAARSYRGRVSGNRVTEYTYRIGLQDFCLVVADWRLREKPVEDWLLEALETTGRAQMKGESSPLTDAMEFYNDEVTRENYVATNYLGEVHPEEVIPAGVEATFPEQFRRRRSS